MHINIRRAISFTLIIGFIILAPLLILHTAGYRYNFKKQKVTSAGSLVIKTEPRNATITINELGITQNSPGRINDLPQNEYTISITKEGFFPWIKKLTVKDMETTFAEDIMLFKNTTEIKITNFTIDQILPLSDQSGFVFISENKIQSFDFSTKQNITLYELPANEVLTNWQLSKNNDFLLITASKNNTLPTLEKNIIISRHSPQNIINLNEKLNTTDQVQIHWSIDNSDTLYLKNNNSILLAKINGNTININPLYTFTPAQKINDFYVINNNLFFLENSADKFFIKRLLLTTSEMDKYSPKLELPNSSYTITGQIGGNLILNDILKKETYIISQDLNNILFRQTNLITKSISSKNNLWAVTDGTEIMLLDQKTTPFNKSTINRVSRGISGVVWTSSSNYLLYNHEGKLNIIELDPREKRNIIELNADNVNEFILDNDGQNIYFTKNNEPGVFQLSLTE